MREADVGGELHVFCCAGCQAVATLIYSGGLERYYLKRDELPLPNLVTSMKIEGTKSINDASENNHSIYDDPAVQASFVRDGENDEKEAVLVLEGLRCAACVWLNEHHLMQQEGVISVQINHTQQRARIRWDSKKTKLSTLFKAIEAIGYRAWPYDGQTSETLRHKEQKSALFRLGVAVMGMMQVMMYAWPVYFSDEAIAPDYQKLLNWVSFVLTVPVIFFSAAPLYRSAFRSLINRHLGMDIPVVLGITAAFIASCVATVKNSGAVYFDSVTMFVGLLLAARYLELRLRQQARSSSEQIMRHIPAACMRWSAYPEGKLESVARIHLAKGDIVQVKPGEVFPADGIVIEGISEAEEALLTGESQPVAKRIGDKVLAGSYNFSSPLVVRLNEVGEETRLAEMARLLDCALTQKPRVAELADRAAAIFVMALLLIAACVALFWLWHDASRVLMVTVAVLVVSCPCALSLATPAALAAATGGLARKSLLILRGHALEALAQVTDVVLDKTGTLTTGKFELVEKRSLGTLSPEKCLAIAASLEQASEHPLARHLIKAASVEALVEKNLSEYHAPESLNVVELRSIPGMGVEGLINGELWRIGRFSFVSELSLSSCNNQKIDSHLSAVWLANTQGLQALFLFSDTLREGAMAFVEAMQQQVKRVHLLSGDRLEAVKFWATKMGIECISAEATPLDKQTYIQTLQKQGAVVAMIGDGVNDAPALASAQVSLTLASGTPLAQAGADIVLMSDVLTSLDQAFVMAKRTRRIIIQNLTWALVYNVVAIPLAATDNLTPLMAGIGMSVSSLLVIINALRLT